MDICHLKNSELDPKFQKYKGRVVLQVQGDVVEDDSGSCAVFTERGSAASQMTAVKEWIVIARLTNCAGQAADAVSAYTSENERRSKIAENSEIRMSRHSDTPTGQNHGPVSKAQLFLLSEICTVILWQNYYGKGNLRKSY